MSCTSWYQADDMSHIRDAAATIMSYKASAHPGHLYFGISMPLKKIQTVHLLDLNSPTRFDHKN